MNTATSERIAVLDAQRIYTDEGARFTIPADAALADLLTRARERKIGQLWVHPSRHGDVPQLEAWIGEARSAGWTLQAPDKSTDKVAFWLNCWQTGTYGRVALAIPAIDERETWNGAKTGAELLASLTAYRQAVGIPVRYSPGTTGLDLLKQLHTGRGALDLSGSVAPADMPPPARRSTTESSFFWLRPLTAAERGRRYLHAYDKNGQFLAACAEVHAGFGMAEHLSGSAARERFDGRAPGYWLATIQPEETHAPEMPYPVPIGTHWMNTISLKIAQELGGVADIAEAYIWPEMHRPLDAWYKRLSAARAALMGSNRTAYTALKQTYSHAIGYMDGSWLRAHQEPVDLYRPDWRHGVIARARTNLYRNAAKAYAVSGAAPFAAAADCWYYVSNEPDPVTANPGLRLGDGLGQYKVKHAAIPLDDLRELLEETEPGKKNHGVLRELQMVLNAMSTPEETGEEVDTLAEAEAEREAGQHE